MKYGYLRVPLDVLTTVLSLLESSLKRRIQSCSKSWLCVWVRALIFLIYIGVLMAIWEAIEMILVFWCFINFFLLFCEKCFFGSQIRQDNGLNLSI